MIRTTRNYVFPALVIALSGAIAALPASDALAKNAQPRAASATVAKKGPAVPAPDALVIKGPRPSVAPTRPIVGTNIEPGIINIEKLNKEVKNSSKRRQLAELDRKKYGIADNMLRELGHKGHDRHGSGPKKSPGPRR